MSIDFISPPINVVDRSDLVRGYEIRKGEYVQVTETELASLEAEANSNIDLREFIPLEKLDPVSLSTPIT